MAFCIELLNSGRVVELANFLLNFHEPRPDRLVINLARCNYFVACASQDDIDPGDEADTNNS